MGLTTPTADLELPETVRSWFENLILLEGVPFRYLVPDECMLPAESIRFFQWYAELHRLRAVFLAAVGAEETQIEASMCEAIRIAKEQNSVSLEERAEGTCAEYRSATNNEPAHEAVPADDGLP